MSLRRPAVHLPTGWRRSGDESQWETRSSKGDSFSHESRRAPRPHSAMEGRQLDGWIQQLQRMQGDADRASASGDRESSDRNWRPYRTPSFSGVSSSYGNMTGSCPGSRESLQSELFVPVGRWGSLERVHISQTPKKEQSQLGYVAPVKTGWLPIQRRVMKVEDSQDQRQMVSPHSAAQVKLKQPITPTILKSRGTVSLHQDDQATRSQRRTWQTPERSPPVIKQAPDKQSYPANEQRKPGIWKVLRRGWNGPRLSGARSGQPQTELHSDPRRESPLLRKTRVEEPSRSPLRTFAKGEQHEAYVSPDSRKEPSRIEEPPLRRPPETFPEAPDPRRRASGGPPLTPPRQPYRRHSLEASHIQTASMPTTLIPGTKVGFSSITISSRKVGRSAGIAASDGPPARAPEPVDPRRAAIVKVTERRTTVSSSPWIPPKKAAIIKVTEHQERSYGPGKEKGTRASAEVGPPVQNGQSVPAELPGQEPKRAAVRKWSLGLPQGTFREAAKNDQQGAVATRWSSTPCLTLIQTPEPHQSPEEVLALNAAAIIANIKLQRQLSKKRAPPCNSEGDSAVSPQGNSAAGDGGARANAKGRIPDRDEPTPDLEKPGHAVSLQEALRKSKPRFIARSQERVHMMERRALERRKRSATGGPQSQSFTTCPRRGPQQHARPTNDNVLKSREGAKELKLNRPVTDVKKRKEDEKKKKKKEACLTNRQRVELFKKKLLDQILHRSNN